MSWMTGRVLPTALFARNRGRCESTCVPKVCSCYDKGKQVAEKLPKHKEGSPTQSMRICRDINIFRVIGFDMLQYFTVEPLDCLRPELRSTNFSELYLCGLWFLLDTPRFLCIAVLDNDLEPVRRRSCRVGHQPKEKIISHGC
jgi:hypothetical protein